MSFFNSDIVKREMEEITELQEIVFENVFKFSFMTIEDKRKHIDVLEKLLEKQKILYTRLSLSDDPEAKLMRKNIIDSAIQMGLSKTVDINILLNKMSKVIQLMKTQIN
jgi:hypothetical protein